MLLVAVMFVAVSRIAPASAIAQAEDAPVVYEIVAGDTLFEIAGRFGITLEELVVANGIADVNLISPGQTLVIPTGVQSPGSDQAAAQIPNTAIVTALPGETLSSISQRVQQEQLVVASLNQMTVTQRLFPGQPVRVMDSYVAAEDRSFGAIVDVTLTDELAQGKTGYVIVTTRKPLELQADWNGLPLIFTPTAGNPLRQFALIPVPGLLAAQPYSFTLSYASKDGVLLSRTWPIQVVDGGYGLVDINLPPDRGGLLDPELVQAEQLKLADIWAVTTPELHWTEVLSRPISAEFETSDPYGTRRSYNGGPYSSYHSGHDYGAPVGITVTAPADGVVVLSEPLVVRGGVVIIDHGRGIYTGFWHLSESFVEQGQAVQAGEPVALVGNTGLSTGAHLHWEFRINGIAVDPTWFLDRPLQP